jgi:hypothetical protein
MSGGIANRRARATAAREDEEHCWIIIRGVSSLPPPSLSLVVARHLKPSVSAESTFRVCCNSMSLDTVRPLFLNLSERALDSWSIE